MVVKTKIKVRFEDIDALGHLNAPKYFNFLEEGRLELFKHLRGKCLIEDIDFVVKYLEGNFLHPLYLGDEVVVETKLVKIGKTSCHLEEKIVFNGKLCFEGKTIITFYDFKNKKKKEVPLDIRKKAEILLNGKSDETKRNRN